MDFLPISINIKDKKILVVGGGNVAYQKLTSILRFTNNVTIISPTICNEILKIENISIIYKAIEGVDLNGFSIVYAATDNRDVNQFVLEEGEKRGSLVCVVDNPHSGHFISSALYVDGNMTVAVGSDGRDLKRSIRWRNAIKDYFTNGRGSGI